MGFWKCFSPRSVINVLLYILCFSGRLTVHAVAAPSQRSDSELRPKAASLAADETVTGHVTSTSPRTSTAVITTRATTEIETTRPTINTPRLITTNTL